METNLIKKSKKKSTKTNTVINVIVDYDQFNLGNKYESVQFSEGMGNSVHGKKFKAKVNKGMTVTWIGEFKDKGQGNNRVDIAEISKKATIDSPSILQKLEYKNGRAIGVVTSEDLNPGTVEYYNISIRVTYDGHQFPDYEIDPSLEYHA